MANQTGRDNGRALLLLAHPLVVFCLVGWAINDHVLKARFHNAITGKLSDVFAMVVFPVLVALVIERWTHRPMAMAIAATALFFASINLFDFADSGVESILGFVWPSGLTKDPTDLVTLPLLAIPGWLWSRRAESSALRRVWGRTVFAGGLFICLATGAPQPEQTETFEGTFVLDEENLEVRMPLEFTLDGEPALPRLEVDIEVLALGNGPDGEGEPPRGVVSWESSDTELVFMLSETAWAPLEVSWRVVGFGEIWEGCGPFDSCRNEPVLRLDAPADTRVERDSTIILSPSNELIAFDPDDFVIGTTTLLLGVEVLQEIELRVASEGAAISFDQVPRGLDLLAATGERLEPGSRTTPIPIPADCDFPCVVSLWSIYPTTLPHPDTESPRFGIFGDAEVISVQSHQMEVAEIASLAVDVRPDDVPGERTAVVICAEVEGLADTDFDRMLTLLAPQGPDVQEVGQSAEFNVGRQLLRPDDEDCETNWVRSETVQERGVITVERRVKVLRPPGSDPVEIQMTSTLNAR